MSEVWLREAHNTSLRVDDQSRGFFEARLAPALRDVAGVEYHGWRIGTEDPLHDEELHEAIENLPLRDGSGLGEALARSYLEVREAATPLTWTEVTSIRYGTPEWWDDLEYDGKRSGLADYLQTLGIEPPDEPAWRYAGDGDKSPGHAAS